MIWIGLAIVVVTFYLIYKNYEARLVLALSGLVMAFIGQVVVGTNGGVSAAVDAFVKQLVNGGLVPTIVTVMGFGYVMTFTKCSDHLVNLLVKPLARVPVIVIRRRHHYLAAKHRAAVSGRHCCRSRCPSYSGTNRPESSSGDGCRCRLHRNMGFRRQPRLDVQPSDRRHCL